MAMISYSQLIFLLSLIISSTIEGHINRQRRQIIEGTNRNAAIPQQKLPQSMPWNNYPYNPSNNPNLLASNDRNNPKQMSSNNQLPIASQTQMESVRIPGYYNDPSFQPPLFSGEKPSGWFGTNHLNWVSSKESELDKNKLAAGKNAGPANPQGNIVQAQRQDGGPFFLQKVAKLYASKGEKAFNFGQFETRQGRGSMCSNHENFEGYTFGVFPCPLPPSTGMNQLNQFCCGPGNYQYCCNAQEFSENQRGAFADPRAFGGQYSPKRPGYPPSTRRILAITLPIAGFVVLAGVGVLVFLYYKKFRTEQHRARKLSGAIRLEDTYSIVPQELPIENTGSDQDEQ